MLFNSKIRLKKGFTLLEVIIAITIVTVGLVSVLGNIYQAVSYTSFSSSRLIALYLLQEGMEIVRNIRDENWLNNRDWNNGLGTGYYEAEADYNDSSLFPYQNQSLRLDPNGFYSYDSGTETRFKRKITISYPNSQDCPQDQCLSVQVTVFWNQLGREHQVQATQYLYNWLQ
jgi:prepilin-type N-terminal cleavage/methylation domain-containing protein